MKYERIKEQFEKRREGKGKEGKKPVKVRTTEWKIGLLNLVVLFSEKVRCI